MQDALVVSCVLEDHDALTNGSRSQESANSADLTAWHPDECEETSKKAKTGHKKKLEKVAVVAEETQYVFPASPKETQPVNCVQHVTKEEADDVDKTKNIPGRACARTCK